MKIDEKNPMIENNEWFKEILKKRKKVHRLFDMIKCSKHWTFFNKDADLKIDMSQFKNLVVRDTIFTFSQL